MLFPCRCKPLIFKRGFTLSELLISLALLGVIAVFTIPKILITQQDSRYNATAKEVVAMISEAYLRLKQDKGISTSTSSGDLSPYMNYVSVANPASEIDGLGDGGTSYTRDCDITCLRLHSGGILKLTSNSCGGVTAFGGTSATHSISFTFDPDGLPYATAGGTGTAIEFLLFYNGRVTTRGEQAGYANSCFSAGGPFPSLNPSWFSWNR
jgi:prepilin-type N-terminal cleavage/methylation domain-containing protein